MDTRQTLSVFVRGDHAFVADWRGRLRVVDISSPTSPREVGSLDTPGQPYDVFVQGNHAFVASTSGSLQVIDVSSPTSLREVGSLALGSATNVFVKGNHAFVASGEGGLRVIDVSVPTAPVEVGSVDTPGQARSVFVRGDHAFVADFRGGLRVIDISSPNSPREVGSVDTLATGGVFVQGNYAFVAGVAGLQVIDVSGPTSPRGVGSVDTPGDVFVRGDQAFVADRPNSLRVIDVSNPVSPLVVGSVDTPGSMSVFVQGDHAYLSGVGLTILRLAVIKEVVKEVVVVATPTPSPAPAAVPSPSLTIVGPFDTMIYLGMNSTVPPFNDPMVRAAIHLLLDRNLIETLGLNFSGSVDVAKVTSIIDPDSVNPNIAPAQDVSRALILLAKAGYPNGFPVRIMVDGETQQQDDRDLASVVGFNLRDANIQSTIEIFSHSTYINRLQTGDFDLVIGRTTADWNDRPALLGRLFLKTSAENFTGFSSSTFDTLFNAASFGAAENEAFGTLLAQQEVEVPIATLAPMLWSR